MKHYGLIHQLLKSHSGGMVDAGDLKSPGLLAVRVRVPSVVLALTSCTIMQKPAALIAAGFLLFCKLAECYYNEAKNAANCAT